MYFLNKATELYWKRHRLACKLNRKRVFFLKKTLPFVRFGAIAGFKTEIQFVLLKGIKVLFYFYHPLDNNIERSQQDINGKLCYNVIFISYRALFCIVIYRVFVIDEITYANYLDRTILG